MGPDTSSPFRLALIAMPWSIFNRPSIQLGALKAYLERESSYRLDNYHPYLDLAQTVSPDIYSQIALSGWAGEALFAPLLFPEKRLDARKLFRRCLTGKIKPLPDFDELVTAVEKGCTRLLTTIPWHHYDLIGFSLCFSQLFASLYMAEKMKEKWPEVPIVFGGSSCSGDIGKSLIDHFPQIDYLVDGEGERQLLDLCHFVSGHCDKLPGKIRRRRPDSATEKDNPVQPVEMDDLPFPDYSHYFKEMHQHFSDRPFIPLLPIEFSRGCWWNKCTFCNLNLQWQKYRSKTSDRMLAETLHLAETHACLHFTFTDNALPPQEADRFFRKLAPKKLDFDFFAEIRTISDPEKLNLYSQTGLKTVQVGIEALSTSLLAKMAKGTTTLDNISVMKMCSASAIRLEGNLITDFPGTTEAEITETLHNLDFVMPFLPLQTAAFFLGYGSPMHRSCTSANAFSIQRIIPHAKNRSLFPKKYLRSMTMLTNSYRGDKKLQHRQWQPVKQKIQAWQNFHKRRSKSRPHPLSYRDGGTFLIIRQERLSDTPLLHRLRGTSRKIYLCCEQPVKITRLLAEFPQVDERILRNFIDEMCDKRLMFQENGHALSLAVRNAGYGRR